MGSLARRCFFAPAQGLPIVLPPLAHLLARAKVVGRGRERGSARSTSTITTARIPFSTPRPR